MERASDSLLKDATTIWRAVRRFGERGWEEEGVEERCEPGVTVGFGPGRSEGWVGCEGGGAGGTWERWAGGGAGWPRCGFVVWVR